MLISVKTLATKYGIKPAGVIHVGAHEAEELDEYDKYFDVPVLWIEAQSDLSSNLEKKFMNSHHKIMEATVWHESGVTLNFNLTNNSQSSSLLEFGTHKIDNPHVQVTKTIQVQTSTLGDLIPTDFKADFINLDIQGVELNALRGMADRIKTLKWIYSEVNKDFVYQDCTLISQLDSFLKNNGFERIATRWCFGQNWGDALYVNASLCTKWRRAKIISYLRSIPWYLLDAGKYAIRPTLKYLKLKS